MMKNRALMSILLAASAIAILGYLYWSGYFSPALETVPPTGEVREFEITAKTWEFNLRMIEVDAGDTVVLRITGLDDGVGSGHGFALPDFRVNEMIREGQTITIEFVADKTGTFTFSCSVPCGAGHSTMTGTLIVR